MVRMVTIVSTDDRGVSSDYPGDQLNQQQLSFPDVSQGEVSDVTSLETTSELMAPVPSSISEDPLRTPPRTLIEDRNDLTEQNIPPTAPPAAVPPPVVQVDPDESLEPSDGKSTDNTDNSTKDSSSRIVPEQQDKLTHVSAATAATIKIEGPSEGTNEGSSRMSASNVSVSESMDRFHKKIERMRRNESAKHLPTSSDTDRDRFHSKIEKMRRNESIYQSSSLQHFPSHHHHLQYNSPYRKPSAAVTNSFPSKLHSSTVPTSPNTLTSQGFVGGPTNVQSVPTCHQHAQTSLVGVSHPTSPAQFPPSHQHHVYPSVHGLRTPSPDDIKDVLNLARSGSFSSQSAFPSLPPAHSGSLYDSLSASSSVVVGPVSGRQHHHSYPQTRSYHPSFSPPISFHSVNPYHSHSQFLSSGPFRPKPTPTSIPVSVVTSGSDYMKRGNNNPFVNQGFHPDLGPTEESADLRTGSLLYRNNMAGKRTFPTSVISTGTRTTSRANLMRPSPEDSPERESGESRSMSPQPHHYHLETIGGHSLPAPEHSHHHQATTSLMSSAQFKPPPLESGNPSKPFKCPLCLKNLASKNVYQLHLRSHSGEKPFVCSQCGNAFSQKTSLTRHMRSHTGERPWACSQCGKRFADKERIKIHMRTHTGEKPFPCPVCHKTFSQKSTVKRHMSVHTGDKPFKCSHCSKGFANRGNLLNHEKTHIHGHHHHRDRFVPPSFLSPPPAQGSFPTPQGTISLLPASDGPSSRHGPLPIPCDLQQLSHPSSATSSPRPLVIEASHAGGQGGSLPCSPPSS